MFKMEGNVYLTAYKLTTNNVKGNYANDLLSIDLSFKILTELNLHIVTLTKFLTTIIKKE